MEYKKLLLEAHKLKAKCEVYSDLKDEAKYLITAGQLVGMQNTLVHLLGSEMADNDTYLEIVKITDYVMGLATNKMAKSIRLIR